MKKFLLSTILIFTACSLLSGQTNTNKVYWVHGFGDNSTTWDTYKEALIPTANQGTSIKWNSSSSLNVAAQTLNTEIYTEVAATKKAIVFGHSAGGLVARKAAQSNSRIRAIITAGTPNQGAGIVTSLKKQSLNNVAKTAISKFENSMAQGNQARIPLLPGIGNPIASLINQFLHFAARIGESLADNAIEDVKKLGSMAAANDMNPDISTNAFLRNLNSTASSNPSSTFMEKRMTISLYE